MKLLYTLLLFCLFPCAPTSAQHQVFYDEGISTPLAEYRHQTIKELKYKLWFSIPEIKTGAITGKAEIAFKLNKATEIVLDFREKASQVKTVKINGKSKDYRLVNDHLVLSQKNFRKGDNVILIDFIAGNQSLNRNDDFLYTLLVPDRARTVFPCFDQPNLKAEFTLKLEVPMAWKAVSNTYQMNEKALPNQRKEIDFAPTEPLSTYLFSFVAGKLEHREYKEGERKISAYYRETDPKKVAQLDVIFKQVMASLHWLEEYTGIAYPFAKYDFIILPGFQYGGMEHTGATLYNDNQLFLSEHPTIDEELRRTQLIAHETSHMWFGDFVTMNWFNDVWTKEVFANYFAACITEPLFPTINHTLNRLKTFTAASLSEDRTPGTTAIRQPLDNLRNAGLIYGQIIYNKAPIMMTKLVELMGQENFRKGIQDYLKTYAYGNATWDELIELLNRYSDTDLKAFSSVWVNQKGMPTIDFKIKEKQLVINQSDSYERNLIWPQRFNIKLCGERDSIMEINLDQKQCILPLPFEVNYLIPNTDGRGYGLFIPDSMSLAWMVDHWQEVDNETSRQVLLMTLYENFLAKTVSERDFLTALYRGLLSEKNVLIASSLVNLLPTPLNELPTESREKAEIELLEFTENHPMPIFRSQLKRMLIGTFRSKAVEQAFLKLWKEQSDSLLNEQDYTKLTYELALRLPEKSDSILAAQRSIINNPDRIKEFDFIARAMTNDTLQQEQLFRSLLKAENRRIEPWTATLLSYLNHPLRESQAIAYIRPGLEILEDVQRTGDIFFPRNWVSALLGHHRSAKAYQEVKSFLEDHPNYPPLLKNKILQAAYPLYRAFSNCATMSFTAE